MIILLKAHKASAICMIAVTIQVPGMRIKLRIHCNFLVQTIFHLNIQNRKDIPWIKLHAATELLETILSPIQWIAKVARHPKGNLFNSLVRAGIKTLGGFLLWLTSSCLFMLEQLEYGDFVIFRAWHFVSHLTCLDIVRCGASRTISYSFVYRNKEQSKKDRKRNSFLGSKAVIIAKIAV